VISPSSYAKASKEGGTVNDKRGGVGSSRRMRTRREYIDRSCSNETLQHGDQGKETLFYEHVIHSLDQLDVVSVNAKDIVWRGRNGEKEAGTMQCVHTNRL